MKKMKNNEEGKKKILNKQEENHDKDQKFVPHHNIFVNKPFSNYKSTSKMYLNQIFNNLCEKNAEGNLNFENFIQFINLPFEISKDIFNALIEDERDKMTKKEFVDGIGELFSKYFPDNNHKMLIILFRIFSANEDFINFKNLIQHFEKILLQIFLTYDIFEMNSFLSISTEVQYLIKKTFDINKIITVDFLIDFETFSQKLYENSDFYYLYLFLMNLLSPIKNKILETFAELQIFEEKPTNIEEEQIYDEKITVNSINCSYEKTKFNELDKIDAKKYLESKENSSTTTKDNSNEFTKDNSKDSSKFIYNFKTKNFFDNEECPNELQNFQDEFINEIFKKLDFVINQKQMKMNLSINFEIMNILNNRNCILKNSKNLSKKFETKKTYEKPRETYPDNGRKNLSSNDILYENGKQLKLSKSSSRSPDNRNIYRDCLKTQNYSDKINKANKDLINVQKSNNDIFLNVSHDNSTPMLTNNINQDDSKGSEYLNYHFFREEHEEKEEEDKYYFKIKNELLFNNLRTLYIKIRRIQKIEELKENFIKIYCINKKNDKQHDINFDVNLQNEIKSNDKSSLIDAKCCELLGNPYFNSEISNKYNPYEIQSLICTIIGKNLIFFIQSSEEKLKFEKIIFLGSIFLKKKKIPVHWIHENVSNFRKYKMNKIFQRKMMDFNIDNKIKVEEYLNFIDLSGKNYNEMFFFNEDSEERKFINLIEKSSLKKIFEQNFTIKNLVSKIEKSKFYIAENYFNKKFLVEKIKRINFTQDEYYKIIDLIYLCKICNILSSQSLPKIELIEEEKHIFIIYEKNYAIENIHEIKNHLEKNNTEEKILFIKKNLHEKKFEFLKFLIKFFSKEKIIELIKKMYSIYVYIKSMNI